MLTADARRHAKVQWLWNFASILEDSLLLGHDAAPNQKNGDTFHKLRKPRPRTWNIYCDIQILPLCATLEHVTHFATLEHVTHFAILEHVTHFATLEHVTHCAEHWNTWLTVCNIGTRDSLQYAITWRLYYCVACYQVLAVVLLLSQVVFCDCHGHQLTNPFHTQLSPSITTGKMINYWDALVIGSTNEYWDTFSYRRVRW